MSVIRLLSIPVAIVFGVALNGAMFWTMWKLTNVEFDLDSVEAVRIEFTRQVRETAAESRREEKVEREPPPATPDLPQISVNTGGVDAGLAVMAPVADVSGALSGLAVGGISDRDVVPLVRINPDYPQRALTRGIEGWVQVQFTITETGSVADAVVIAADPPNIFDDAAIKAILRWRYNPMLQEGVPVSRPGMATILRFNLED